MDYNDTTSQLNALDSRTAQRVQQLMEETGCSLSYAMAAVSHADTHTGTKHTHHKSTRLRVAGLIHRMMPSLR
jgi:hypothetical protein